MHVRGPSAVLEVVDPVGVHEVVLHSAKIEPALSQMVNEQRAGIEHTRVRRSPPSVAFRPRGVSVSNGKRVVGRPEAQDVELRLRYSRPTGEGMKPVSGSLSERTVTVVPPYGPSPVDPPIERIPASLPGDLTLDRVFAIK